MNNVHIFLLLSFLLCGCGVNSNEKYVVITERQYQELLSDSAAMRLIRNGNQDKTVETVVTRPFLATVYFKEVSE